MLVAEGTHQCKVWRGSHIQILIPWESHVHWNNIYQCWQLLLQILIQQSWLLSRDMYAMWLKRLEQGQVLSSHPWWKTRISNISSSIHICVLAKILRTWQNPFGTAHTKWWCLIWISFFGNYNVCNNLLIINRNSHPFD